jgi:hypothetical protein
MSTLADNTTNASANMANQRLRVLAKCEFAIP